MKALPQHTNNYLDTFIILKDITAKIYSNRNSAMKVQCKNVVNLINHPFDLLPKPSQNFVL